MSDLEIVLLAWAVIATVIASQYREREALARKAFMHLVRDPKARKKILDDWEEFKKANNVREGV